MKKIPCFSTVPMPETREKQPLFTVKRNTRNCVKKEAHKMWAKAQKNIEKNLDIGCQGCYNTTVSQRGSMSFGGVKCFSQT